MPGTTTAIGSTQGGDLFGLGIDNVVLLVGALLGVVGSLVAQLIVLWCRRRYRKQRLRRAFREEIRTMEEDIYLFAKDASNREPNGMLVPPDMFVLTVYESNASEIGILSDQEVSALTDFYTRLQQLKERLKAVRGHSGPSPTQQRLIQRDIIALHNQRIAVFHSLQGGSGRRSDEEGLEGIDSEIQVPELNLLTFLESLATEGGTGDSTTDPD